MDLNRAGMKRFLDLNEMEELRNNAYNNSNIAKQRLKRWHDQLVFRKEFQKGQRVLLYDSKLHIFPGKLKSRWIGLFTIQQVYSNGVTELLNSTALGVSKSMANVSSHSWSHFLETRRKSTSLSHIKPLIRDIETTDFSTPEPSVCRIPPKRTRTSGPGETSRHAQPDHQALTDSQHPSNIAPEAIFKRPMVTASPIEGNSDCRAKPFHSELYFDIEAM
ncbi:hypothetical protein CK203_041581 [Vitis vinifera]|uniref:Uncharacterized protein n=1 Tax=Vitis vinifera TaxID=29760 RepID=A0A438I7G7_VITVI|nr:hypothetical protein CK203_041581 [Vitis vinifera]